MKTKQWVAWSHYNSIPYRRLFHKWAYCITKTIQETSLSANQAEKVFKSSLVNIWFTENLQNFWNNLRVGTFIFARKRNGCISNSFFCCVLVEFINIVEFTSIMDLQQMNTMTKAKLVYDRKGGEALAAIGCKGYRHVLRQYRFFESTAYMLLTE